MPVFKRPHIAQQMGERFKKVGRKGFHYLGLLKWLFKDSVWRFKVYSLVILISGFLGVTSQVAGIGQAIYYLRLLEKGNVISAFGFSFEPRSSLFVFVLFTGVIFVSLLASSWFIYLSRKKINRLRRRYEEFCSSRAFESFAQDLRLNDGEEPFFTDRTILQTVRRDANFCGRTVQMLLEGIIPVITLIAAVGVLFYTNVWLTVLIVGVMALSMSLHYGINRRGAEMSLLMEKTIVPATAEKREIISRFRGLSVMPSSGSKWMERHFEGGATKRNLDAAEGRRMATETSKLISDLVFSVVLCLILVTLGVFTFVNHKDWAGLVVFVVALRFCFVNFRAVMSKITAINRFYPQFLRYFRFVTRGESTEAAKNGKRKRLLVCRNCTWFPDSLQEFRLGTDHSIGVISPVPLNRYTVAFLADCLMGASHEGGGAVLSSMEFVTSNYGCLPTSIQESLGLPEGYGWDDIKTTLNDEALIGRLKRQLPKKLGEPCTAKLWESIDSDAKFVMGMLALSFGRQQWLMLEAEELRSLDSGLQEKLLGLLSNQIKVIVYHSDISEAGKYFHDVIAVLGLAERSIIGLGAQEWFLAHEEEIKDLMKKTPSKGVMAVEDESELEYEEDEDM